MAYERKIKPKKTPVVTGSDVENLSKRGWVLRERKNHPMDYSSSSPITIEAVWPEIDGGRYAVKREVGDKMDVFADIFHYTDYLGNNLIGVFRFHKFIFQLFKSVELIV